MMMMDDMEWFSLVQVVEISNYSTSTVQSCADCLLHSTSTVERELVYSTVVQWCE